MANTGMWTVVFFGCAILTWFDFWGLKSSSNSEKIIPTLKKPTNPLPTLQFMFCELLIKRSYEIETLVNVLCIKIYLLLFGFTKNTVQHQFICLQVSFCLMTFLLGNIIEGQLLSTGAFEIYLDGEYQNTFASQLHISDRTYWFF
ncbi:uncharacterized protein DC041_0011249 [Schistosoma bovis]|uniref:Uncharacterized protein n=1 Tax=Schistosoma bovis TaxID=6184 RepID=A0A430QBV6_SCHBO|nr:uncharacterized protein DC041_0011249 [Schistosoma bovis]